MSDKTIYDFADSENIIEIYNAILNRKLSRFPKDTWIPVDKGLMNARLVTKYLIENVLQWSEEDVINNLHYYVFVQYKLGGMLGRVFHGSTFNALDNAYPGKYDPKQMEQTFLGEYDFDNEIQRLRSILKNHSPEEINEYARADLEMKLNILADIIHEQPEIIVTYFQPDEKKEGGAYITVNGITKRIDNYEQVIVLLNREKIPLMDILDIKCEFFKDFC